MGDSVTTLLSYFIAAGIDPQVAIEAMNADLQTATQTATDAYSEIQAYLRQLLDHLANRSIVIEDVSM